jgi:hypothetical protein
LAAALGLAACGGGGSNGLANDSAHQIVSAAAQALKKASSVRLTGGYQGRSVDLAIFSNGAASGRLAAGGQSFNLIVLSSGAFYVKAPAAFWTTDAGAPASVAARISNIWVKLPNKGSLGLGALSLRGLAHSLLSPNGSLSKIGTRTVAGQQSVGVRSSKGGTLWVPTSGSALPVEITAPGGKGTLFFNGWNSETTPTAPKGAKSLTTG